MPTKQVHTRLCAKFVTERDKKEGNKGRPAFDIIAGTSIGAMNSAVLTSYVVENGMRGLLRDF